VCPVTLGLRTRSEEPIRSLSTSTMNWVAMGVKQSSVILDMRLIWRPSHGYPISHGSTSQLSSVTCRSVGAETNRRAGRRHRGRGAWPACGGSLRGLRKQREMSSDQLALASGVSRAALSQIESARTNPTLSILWKVAVGLGVPFHSLLGSGGTSQSRASRELLTKIAAVAKLAVSTSSATVAIERGPIAKAGPPGRTGSRSSMISVGGPYPRRLRADITPLYGPT
jgi:transcriptional regulator with XRE-family HTH domain